MKSNQQLIETIRIIIDQTAAQGMDTDDQRWMATGAGLRLAREQGVIAQDEESPIEMVVAVKAIVEQELKRRGMVNG